MSETDNVQAIPPVNGVQFPEFEEVYFRPEDYVQNVGAHVELDPYTVHSYQYATSSKPGECTPKAIIYAKEEADVLKAIQYAVDTNVALAVRTGGHHFWGFSSTTGENIQLDMSQFTSHTYDEESRTLTAGVGIKLMDVDTILREKNAFIPHGQCGTVCLGGHLQSGGFSVLCGRSFGWFCDHITQFKMITADLKTLTIVKPSEENPNPENDEIWFATVGGSPGNFGVVTEMTIKPLFDENYPESRSSTIYFPYSEVTHKKLLEVVAKYNDDDDLPADFNLTAFVLGRYGFKLRQNIDTKMMKLHPEIYGADPGYHPYILGIWGTWCNVDGGEYTQQAKDFFQELDDLQCDLATDALDFLMKLMELFKHGEVAPVVSPDEPTSMSSLTHSFGFPERVHANPYVSATWCGQSQDTSTNGFADWASSVTKQVYKQKGTYADFEWVVCGGKYSANVTGAVSNPTAVAWRDTTILCFQYVHYDNTTTFGKDWKVPGEFSLNWVAQTKLNAVGPYGVIGVDDRRWNAFPEQDENLDEQRLHYFQSEEVYQRVLEVKRNLDPKDIFTPNLFCVGASTSTRYSNE